MIGKYSNQFPKINEAVCHCKEKHPPGCGCLSEQFIEKARNSFSFILSTNESAEMFATKINALAKHACDVHKWDNGCCDFHSQQVCSCNHCEGKENFKCEGQDYHTRLKLTCPFHSLAYEIECHVRAQMAEQVVHPILNLNEATLIGLKPLTMCSSGSGQSTLTWRGFIMSCPPI